MTPNIPDCGCGGQGLNCQTKQRMITSAIGVIASLSTLFFFRNFNTNLLIKSTKIISYGSLTKFSIEPLTEASNYLKNLLNGQSDYSPVTKEELTSKNVEENVTNLTTDETKKHGQSDYSSVTKEELISKNVEVKENVKNLITDDSKQQIILCGDDTCKVWSKNGPHLIVAGKDKDIFYFSLCSTKVIDHKVTTIINFNPQQDKISFFCTKKIIKLEDIQIKHNEQNTCINVQGNDYISSICFAEKIDFSSEDINLTTLGQVKYELAIEE